MTPFVFEDRVLPSYAVPDAPVRECPLCPPWMECAHFGDEVVRLRIGDQWEAHVASCPVPHHRNLLPTWYVEHGRELQPLPPSITCSGWAGRVLVGTPIKWMGYDTEAEARAEFDRRVALMLGREEVSA